MNIVFLVRTLTYGGAERQLVALACGLKERGHNVRVMVFYPGGPLEADLTAAGVPVLSASKHGRWDVPGFLLRMGRMLRAEHPQIVHGYLGGANITALLLRPMHRGRVVWGVRASDIDLARYDWLSRLDSQIERRLSRFASLIIANSHAGRDYALAQGFPSSTTITIPNGIDTARFAPDAAGRAAVRAELGIADTELLVGRVGRIDPQKDYPTFLRAAALIAGERPNARFICVGTGPDDQMSALRTLAHELGIAGRVIWAGARGDMPAVFSALDLGLSSSAYGEGTPNVVAEAMACGVPCVVTDVGDSAITVGDARRVVPSGNPAALAAAAIELIDLVAAGGHDAGALRARVIESLSLGALVDRSEAALAGMLSGAAKRGVAVREAAR